MNLSMEMLNEISPYPDHVTEISHKVIDTCAETAGSWTPDIRIYYTTDIFYLCHCKIMWAV